MKQHAIVTTPQGRISFSGREDHFRSLMNEPIYYPDNMKWSFNLPFKSEFEQVYKDLTAIRRLRAFLRDVAMPVSDLWTSAAYPMGVPVERRYYTGNVVEPTAQDIIDHFNGVRDPMVDVWERLMRRYCMSDVRETIRQREILLRWNLNSTYGGLYRGR